MYYATHRAMHRRACMITNGAEACSRILKTYSMLSISPRI